MLRAHRGEGGIQKTFLLGAFALSMAPQVVGANDLIPYPYGERRDKADVVIIGRALSLTGSEATCCDNFAAIRVMQVLKGRAPHVVNVYTQNKVIDLDPRCCRIGKTYLFFLSKRPGGVYAIEDGRFGAIPLD